jgi:23S rRNA (guanosine2251-2'-O)-methyltransferase
MQPPDRHRRTSNNQDKRRDGKRFGGKSRGPQRRVVRSADPSDALVLYGLHSVEAALRNPQRPVRKLFATPNAANKLADAIAAREIAVETVTPKQLDKRLGSDAVHQGVLLETGPLPEATIEAVAPQSLVLVLDQVTDPHNVGALLRSAAAFGAEALIMQERHSAPLNAVLAKSASGALDLVPVILVRNLAKSLEELKSRGFYLVGLAEQGSVPLTETAPRAPLAIVLGAEGKGLRQLTRETCDRLCRIETEGRLASLNVSNAGAIALYWANAPQPRGE